jgi:acyl dehydratase
MNRVYTEHRMNRLAFEDFVVGTTIQFGSHTFTEAEILEFAHRFDPQSFHIDAAAAAKSPYGGLIASGWHTCSVIMGELVRNALGNSTSLGSPGVDEIRWLKPVRPGDTLTMYLSVTATKPSESKPDRGVVWTEWTADNQHGEQVIVVHSRGLFGRRAAQERA